MSELSPQEARVVVVGGGIVGCSVDYHLTQIGWNDVALLERKKLASGTTWAAAGLVGQLWANKALTRLAKYGATLNAGLEMETGQPTGWKKSGSIRVARTREREQEFDRAMDMAHGFGIPMEKISLAEARRMIPVISTEDLVAAWYQPDDGCTNPEDTTQALAKGARARGARILQGVKVTDILRRNGAVCGVATDRGDIACACVALCAAMWSWQIGRNAGVAIPLHAAEHMHMTTNPIAGVPVDMPYMRDMDGCIYVKEETGGLLMDGFEPMAMPWTTLDIPDDFEHTNLQDNMELMEDFMGQAVKRVPAFESAEVSSITTLPESFTPDTAYMLGEVPALKNLFVAAGMNSVGIASAAGAGKALAQWIAQGHPEEDLWAVDIRRFGRWQGNLSYLRDRAVEAVGVLYADHWPYRQRTAARQARCSPFHDRLSDRGACFGVVAGWERANWFAPRGVRAEYNLARLLP